MNKPLLGVLLGALLGAFDGLSALVSAPTPEIKAGIVGIVIGSTFKGLLVGVAAGFFARKVRSLPKGVVFGGVVGLVLAALVSWINLMAGQPPYWLEIVLPGAIVGLILGYATQRYGSASSRPELA